MHHEKCKGPFQTAGRLILASGSPRRKELLKGLGLEFHVVVPEVEELDDTSGLSPGDMVMENARLKAEKVAEADRKAIVIGADTCVFIDGRILGKPMDRAQAEEMLSLLSGRWHRVYTGFCIVGKSAGIEICEVVDTGVLLHAFSREIIAAYCSTSEPYDKAGAYAVQAVGGFMVKRIDGSYTNVVGLPVSELLESLLRIGVIEICARN